MGWIFLVLAGIFEIVWAVGLKYGGGLNRPLVLLATVGSIVASFILLGLALRSLPLGVAYAIWTGIGTVGAIIFGMAIFGETASLYRLACLALIVAGMVGLKLSS
jgi:quaternary ammonium compound-resistance protein SugE